MHFEYRTEITMRKKFFIMAIVSYGIALAIYVFTFHMYHYLGPDCSFGNVYYEEPCKPLITFFFGIWGVMHQFAAVTSFVIGLIFFKKEKAHEENIT